MELSNRPGRRGRFESTEGSVRAVLSDSSGVTIFVTEEAIGIRTEIESDLMFQVQRNFWWDGQNVVCELTPGKFAIYAFV